MNSLPPWFPGMPLPPVLPQGSGALPQAPVQLDPVAYLNAQRQQAEQAFQQAWQNLSVLTEMSRQRDDADAAMASPACEMKDMSPEPKKTAEGAPQQGPNAAACRAQEQKPDMESGTQQTAPPPQEAKAAGEVEKDKDEATREHPPNQILVRIRRVGSFDTGDGTLEIFARFTEKGKEDMNDPEKYDRARRQERPAASSASNAGTNEGDQDPGEYVRPKPKKMPLVRRHEVAEPSYPPKPGHDTNIFLL